MTQHTERKSVRVRHQASPSTPRLADPEIGALDDIVNLDKFGLSSTSASWDELGRTMATHLDRDGIASLAGFLRPAVVATIAQELDAMLPFVAIGRDRRSAYSREFCDATAHPAVSATSDWVAGHVTRDMIPAQSPAHRLYVSPLFKRLVASCLGRERVFEYADPLAGLVATVLPPGGRYGWHYDTNEYVVTIGVRQASEGGTFEFHHNLRSVGDENLDGLVNVLDGRDVSTRRSAMSAPGDLQIFRGRYSLHRVTNVSGRDHRLTLVLSYADQPGLIGPLDRTRRVYGRVTEAHLVAEAAARGADGLFL